MTTGPTWDGTASNGLAVPLRVLFFVTFVAACVARWAAHFGVGVFVAFFWCAVLGFIIGVTAESIVTAAGLLFKVVTKKTTVSGVLPAVATTAVAGCLAGFCGGAFGFALSTIGPVEQVLIKGAWFEALFTVRGKSFDITNDMTAFVFVPAAIAAFALTLANVIRRTIKTAPVRIVFTGGLLTLLFGAIPMLSVAIWLLFFPPRPPPPVGRHEDMLGLLPVAVAIWSTVFGAVGGISGLTAAALLAWIDHARSNRCSRALLWCATVAFTLFITETALRSWVGHVAHWVSASNR